MDNSSTDEFDAWMRMRRIAGLEVTTTLPSDAKPFCASTASDNEKKEFTDSASILPDELEILEMNSEDMERFCTEWQAGLGSHIFVSSVSSTTNPSQMKNSNDGSTGPFPEEVEPLN